MKIASLLKTWAISLALIMGLAACAGDGLTAAPVDTSTTRPFQLRSMPS